MANIRMGFRRFVTLELMRGRESIDIDSHSNAVAAKVDFIRLYVAYTRAQIGYMESWDGWNLGLRYIIVTKWFASWRRHFLFSFFFFYVWSVRACEGRKISCAALLAQTICSIDGNLILSYVVLKTNDIGSRESFDKYFCARWQLIL